MAFWLTPSGVPDLWPPLTRRFASADVEASGFSTKVGTEHREKHVTAAWASGWNRDVSAIEAPPLQRLVDAGIGMLDTPPGSELASLAAVGIDNRRQQEIEECSDCLSVGVSDRASSDKQEFAFARRSSYWARLFTPSPGEGRS